MPQFCFNAFNQSPYVGGSIDLMTQIDAAASAGFAYLGPDMYSIDAWLQSGGSLQALADRLAARGIKCWEIAAGLVLGDPAESLAAARRIVPIASALQPAWVQINVGTIGHGTSDTLGRICEVLAPTGAKVAVEYLPFMALRSIAETHKLVERVGFERARVLVDSWHHFRGPDSDGDLDMLPLEAIAYVQFDDAMPCASADLPDETLNRRIFPGEGEFDLAGFCGRLKRKGFDGVVSVEILNAEWRERDIFEFARRAYDATVAFWT